MSMWIISRGVALLILLMLGISTGQGENRPVWNNVQRLNHQNHFVPTAVLTRTGRIPVNTARRNPSSQAATTSTTRKVNVVRPIENENRPRNNFHKSHSPIRRPFNRTTTTRTSFSNQKVNTTRVKAVNDVGGKRETAYNPQRALKNKGVVDSGYSRHMTGNKAYLAEYQDYNGGPIAFGGSKGYITGKGMRSNQSRVSKINMWYQSLVARDLGLNKVLLAITRRFEVMICYSSRFKQEVSLIDMGGRSIPISDRAATVQRQNKVSLTDWEEGVPSSATV
ncbi:hypothetical protein Tco_0598916 [Tanacetum coccineum]